MAGGAQFPVHLEDHGIPGSMALLARVGDNALVEPFFAALKNEPARRVIAEYAEAFYNWQDW